MRPTLSVSLMAILAAISISACSSSSNSSTTATTDTNAVTSAAAPAGDATVYPGAKSDTPPGATGTPPPGVKAFSTTDDAGKVMTWYKANVKDGKAISTTPEGGLFQIGDAKKGAVVMIQNMNGKTWILMGPAGSPQH